MEARASTSTVQRGRSWGRWAVIGLVGLFIALLVYGLASQGPDDAIDGALTEGRAATAPAFTLEVLDRGTLPPRLRGPLGGALADGRLSLAELRGTPVVLNLWASWCTPCREEAPRLQKGWERWGPRGVAYLGLNIQDLRGDARGFGRSSASPTRACATPAAGWPTATGRRASRRPSSWTRAAGWWAT